MGDHFKIAAIQVTAKDHPAIEGLAVVDHRSAMDVDDRFSVSIFDLLARVTEVPVQLAVGTKHERMVRMVVLMLAGLGKQRHLAVGNIIAVVVDQPPDVGSRRDDDLVAQHTNSHR